MSNRKKIKKNKEEMEFLNALEALSTGVSKLIKEGKSGRVFNIMTLPDESLEYVLGMKFQGISEEHPEGTMSSEEADNAEMMFLLEAGAYLSGFDIEVDKVDGETEEDIAKILAEKK